MNQTTAAPPAGALYLTTPQMFDCISPLRARGGCTPRWAVARRGTPARPVSTRPVSQGGSPQPGVPGAGTRLALLPENPLHSSFGVRRTRTREVRRASERGACGGGSLMKK